MLLWSVKYPLLIEQTEESASQVALEAAADLAIALALLATVGHVGQRLRVVQHAAEGDRVQGSVELAVAAPVEAVTDDLARGSFDGCHASQAGESGFVTEAAAVRPAAEQVSGADGADTGLGQQPRGELLDQRFELGVEVGNVIAGGEHAMGSQAQGGRGGAVFEGVFGWCPEAGAALAELPAGQPPELVAKRLRGVGDQRFELDQGRAVGADGGLPSDKEHA
jgi:hypothetical protein